MIQPLTPQRFAALLDAWGADPARWPETERDAALALLAQSEAARRQRAQAAHLDALLAGLDAPAPSGELRLRILRVAPVAGERRGSPWRRLWDELGGWRLAMPALAAALALGIGAGTQLPALAGGDDLEAELLALARLDDPYTEYAP